MCYWTNVPSLYSWNIADCDVKLQPTNQPTNQPKSVSNIIVDSIIWVVTLSIDRDGQLRTSLYDKRDDFNFQFTIFPFPSSNIPSSPAHGVFISQHIRYARACYSYESFILRAVRLSNKLLGQGYVKERLKSSIRKFYGRYGDLAKQYEVPLSRMLHDILEEDHIQWHPHLIRHYTNFWHFTDLDLITEFEFLT